VSLATRYRRRYHHSVLNRLVFDTTVIVAAMRSDRGASRVLLTEALGKRFTLLASVPLMLEYEAVATRPEHLEAAGLSEVEVQAVLDALATVIEPVRLAYLWRPMLPDADDDMVLETAVNGQADLLVTVNRRDFVPGAARFGIRIASPAEALTRLRRNS
jgi:putative PIN family toxin of toxin-antitoxin system